MNSFDWSIRVILPLNSSNQISQGALIHRLIVQIVKEGKKPSNPTHYNPIPLQASTMALH